MPRRGQVFTPRAVKIIRGLADQGKSASEIADVIGSTPASVRVRCCQLKIKLPRRGRPSRSGSRPRDMQERRVAVYVRSPSERRAEHYDLAGDDLRLPIAGLASRPVVRHDPFAAGEGRSIEHRAGDRQ